MFLIICLIIFFCMICSVIVEQKNLVPHITKKVHMPRMVFIKEEEISLCKNFSNKEQKEWVKMYKCKICGKRSVKRLNKKWFQY